MKPPQPLDSFKPGQPVCGLDSLLWIIVLLLLLGLGLFVTLGALMGAAGLPETGVTAMLLLGGYCALLLVGLLVAGLGLSLAHCCPGVLRPAKGAVAPRGDDPC